MSTFLLILFVILVTWCLLIAIGVAIVSWRLDKRNRVSPEVASPAPFTWLMSPAKPAVLHRRLRNAVQLSRMAVALPDSTDPELSVPHLRQQMEEQAVALDHHVVMAARLSRPHRRRTLGQLERDVREVETISRRLTVVDRRPPHAPLSGWTAVETPPAALGRIADQLRLLEEAQAEVDWVERTGGMVDAEDVLRQAPPHHRAAADAAAAASVPGPTPRALAETDAGLEPPVRRSSPPRGDRVPSEPDPRRSTPAPPPRHF